MPTPQELAALRNNVLNAFGDYSTLSQLGRMGAQVPEIAQLGRDFTLEDKGAVFLSAMLDEYFRVASDQNVYRNILERANGFVDREKRQGGRAWSLVRSRLLEIGRERGWSTADTIYDDWTPDQRKQFSEMIERDAPKKRGGCFVATAVYGSYDCPEVWVLRRFRDHSLISTRIGRAFVRAYYLTSPTAVRSAAPHFASSRSIRSHCWCGYYAPVAWRTHPTSTRARGLSAEARSSKSRQGIQTGSAESVHVRSHWSPR